MNRNPILAVLSNRHFRNLWLGQITSQIALNMLSFILAIKVYQETHSNTAVSLLLLMFGLPAIVFGIIAGGIVDEYDKRLILIYCNFLRLLLFLAFFFLHTNLFAIYLMVLLFSLATQAFIPAEAPSIPSLIEKRYLLSANSLFTVSFYVSTIIGFIVSGPVLQQFGEPNVYIIMALFMGLATLFVSRLPKMKAQSGRTQLTITSVGQAISEGLQFINGNKRIKQSLLLMTFAQALIITLSMLAPGFADKVLSIQLTQASYLVMGPAAVGLILGAILIGLYGSRYLKGVIILLGIISTGIILLLLSLLTRVGQPGIADFLNGFSPLFSSLLFAFVLLFFLGFFNSFITVPANTILQEEAVGTMSGRIYGVLTSATGGISVLPVVFSGILADVVGVGKTLFFIGIVILITAICHYLRRRKNAYIIK